MSDESHAFGVNECLYGVVTVGERGQVVIPADARQELGLKAGDKILVMRHPVMKGLMLAKFESLRDYFDEIGMLMKRVQDGDSEETQE